MTATTNGDAGPAAATEARVAITRGIVALVGASVDTAGSQGAASVPGGWQEKRRERDGDAFHVTLATKEDVQLLLMLVRDGGAGALAAACDGPVDSAAVVAALASIVMQEPCPLLWVDLGGGRVTDGDSEASFQAVAWPAGAAVRARLGLPVRDFHITTGFSARDVHGKAKGPSALGRGVPEPASVAPLVALASARLAAAPAGKLAADAAEEVESLATLAADTAESHSDVAGRVAALELKCSAQVRAQAPRRLLQTAGQLLELVPESQAGQRASAAALMSLRRHAEALQALEKLESAGPVGTVGRWLAASLQKCRDALGAPDSLFPGCEDCANADGDDTFEREFSVAGSALKFPSTAHLKNLGAATRDDKVCGAGRVAAFCGGVQAVFAEEKIDGANLGISLDSSFQVRMQARSKMVNWNTDPQFAGLQQWLEVHSATLCALLERNNDILFGEWCAYLHTVKYDRMPGYFFAFDIYDRRKARFLSRSSFHGRLARAPGSKIPAVPLACAPRAFGSTQEVEQLLQQQSRFGPGPLEGVYLRIDEPLAEGHVGETYLVDRCKLVRAEFQQAIADEGSWRGRGKNDLDVSSHAEYVESCYPCARG